MKCRYFRKFLTKHFWYIRSVDINVILYCIVEHQQHTFIELSIHYICEICVMRLKLNLLRAKIKLFLTTPFLYNFNIMPHLNEVPYSSILRRNSDFSLYLLQNLRYLVMLSARITPANYQNQFLNTFWSDHCNTAPFACKFPRDWTDCGVTSMDTQQLLVFTRILSTRSPSWTDVSFNGLGLVILNQNTTWCQTDWFKIF